MSKTTLAPVLAGILTVAATAQYGHLAAGPFPIDLLAATGNPNCLGVARSALGGVVRFWVTARQLVAGGPHLLYELDAAGAMVAVHNQPPTASPAGIRDLAWDGGNILFGGHELGAGGAGVLHRFDIGGGGFLPSLPVAASGPAAALGTIRALAFVPGGPWQLFAADQVGNAYPLQIVAGVVNVLPPMPAGLNGIIGAGYDQVERRLFFFANGAYPHPCHPAPVNVVIQDAEYCNGLPIRPGTDVTFGNLAIGGNAGGMEVYRRGPYNLRFGVVLQQTAAGNDFLVEVDLQLERGSSCTCGPLCGGVRPADVHLGGGAATPMNPGFQLELRRGNCAAGGVAAFLVSLAAPIPPIALPAPPFAPGCNLLVDPALSIMLGPVGISAAGTAVQPLPIGLPCGAPALGVTAQAALLGAGAYFTSRAASFEIRP
ncbi:MAG: hypothetical protein IPM29_16295 [Planctomycetes bacterium]|nr:hypothetical protein [Planctomycetota bacterium]